MSWGPQNGGTGFGDPGSGNTGFAVPPPPPLPPSPPPAPADPLRAVAVALLNLGGLGLGYALIRRWAAAAVCWTATGVLLLAALPADPDGVPGGLLAGYLALLGAAAVHGAVRGLRTPLSWPPRPPVAVLLGLVLLAVPAGGAAAYTGARDEAVERMLLDRLDRADRLVRTAGSKPFAAAEPDYREALAVYRDLSAGHPGSRAAGRVPDRLETYYETVGAPYGRKRYCDAIAPLEHLRTVPGTMGGKALGSLADWPDERLATSLYECGAEELGDGDDGAWEKFGDLLADFPGSPQAQKVDSAVAATIDEAAEGLKGDDPCSAVERLRAIGTGVAGLPGEEAGLADALDENAGRADRSARSGAYACGVDRYRDGRFDEAIETLNDFVDTHKRDRNRARAQKIVIAAEIAQEIPEAGRRLPTTASGGSIAVTVKNDSPEKIRILYTGPVTGSFTLPACDDCSTYPSALTAGSQACKDSGKNYPQRTVHLPAGTTYFLHKPMGGSGASPATDTVELDHGYIYTECAYTTQSFGFGS
ncbi:hypothetical protein GCM10010420_52990 [Streptomyces glaucosporus]|uniref:Uncharacterized protein n=1 Tax=Streptomyces glaucosporus TaxID=284044 RepID=A0ABN3IWV0_9ACTN